MSQYFICGDDHPPRLQEHHVVPRRYGGSDSDDNLVTLCASCHQAIEKLYDDDFYRRLGVEKALRNTELTPVASVGELTERTPYYSEEFDAVWRLTEYLPRDADTGLRTVDDRGAGVIVTFKNITGTVSMENEYTIVFDEGIEEPETTTRTGRPETRMYPLAKLKSLIQNEQLFVIDTDRGILDVKETLVDSDT